MRALEFGFRFEKALLCVCSRVSPRRASRVEREREPLPIYRERRLVLRFGRTRVVNFRNTGVLHLCLANGKKSGNDGLVRPRAHDDDDDDAFFFFFSNRRVLSLCAARVWRSLF